MRAPELVASLGAGTPEPALAVAVAHDLAEALLLLDTEVEDYSSARVTLVRPVSLHHVVFGYGGDVGFDFVTDRFLLDTQEAQRTGAYSPAGFDATWAALRRARDYGRWRAGAFILLRGVLVSLGAPPSLLDGSGGLNAADALERTGLVAAGKQQLREMMAHLFPRADDVEDV
ncbi:MAG TPA: hypothetical protein VGO62_17195 [Myxococcota bacterium]